MGHKKRLHRALLYQFFSWYHMKHREMVLQMRRDKKDCNMEIGERLHEIRKNMDISQAEVAEILNVSDEHYRKLECGSAGLTIDKIRILYEKLQIDPSWLLVGKSMEQFNIDEYLVNCSKEQRDDLLCRCLNYITKYITKNID